jgi:hypothetical protein
MLSLILSSGVGLFSPSLVGVLLIVLTAFIVLGAVATRLRKRKLVSTAKNARVLDENAMNTTETQPCVMICDPGRESDTELALVLLRGLRDLKYIDPKGVIANLWPQQERARLLRGTLDSLGLHDVPVAFGTNGGSVEYRIDTQRAESYMSLKGSERAGTIVTGRRLLEQTFEEALPHSLVLILTSSLTVSQTAVVSMLVIRSTSPVVNLLFQDAAIFFRDSESLFVDKIKSVVVVGGVEMPRQESTRRGGSIQAFFESQNDQPMTSASFRPDPSDVTNSFDLPAARFFYQRCSDFGVPLVIVKSEVRLLGFPHTGAIC